MSSIDKLRISLKGTSLGGFIKHSLICMKLLSRCKAKALHFWCTWDRLWQLSMWCMEIKELSSVGGDRRQSWKVENVRLMRARPAQTASDAFFCVFLSSFIPLFCRVLKLSAVCNFSRRGIEEFSSLLYHSKMSHSCVFF